MAMEIALDELRSIAVRAGLSLAEEELQKLLPGVNRSRKQVEELRESLSVSDEPAGTFAALKSEKV